MFIDQKSQQISLALIRISVQVRRQDLRSRLERMAFQLLEDVAGDQFEFALNDIEIIKSLSELGKDIYQIEPINAKIIAKELGILESAIRQNFGINSGNVDIGDIFSKSLAIPEPYSGNQKADAASSILEPILNTADSAADFGQNNHSQSSNSHSSNGNGNGINSTIRQSAIIDIIRQSKKIGLKDVLAAFPDVSERTLRYDLQKLCIQGVLDRIGNGGPATYYTLKM
ncbi:MAG: hypothetical protein A3I24_01820 [Candidatus Harrisonbacteria bacterium RIFCSPLOWO2_02_FULL_41_13b]|uniref:HTH deoR-type domain-containing protein n=1 Tax=Candidatus Harrisonbacteria bacterium RIFCSPLOWO2_02_FULL_41_13b TaxID=1798409 RepID=A0A1G1ZS09_9BACT|nr:MAG: hypothetical protein A3I24_01820 [Candidatus Harrisonbacteria bacterium RIFCSPLOWO2_02_FULL_41_13b]